MKTVALVHWREPERREKKKALEKMGVRVSLPSGGPPEILAELKTRPPAAVVLDLSRSPAQGRDLAVALRVYRGTRRVPQLFVGGEEGKVNRIRELLPDAFFTTWTSMAAVLREALENPPEDPLVPDSMLAAYAGTPLPRKLGIKAGYSVLLVQPPDGFPALLPELPEGVRLLRRYSSGVDLILWFVRSDAALQRDIVKWASRVGKGGIWILWPKRASSVSSDLTQAIVRRAGLSHGLVDYKIASVDDTWSGLKFSVREEGS